MKALDAISVRRMHEILAQIHQGQDLRAALSSVADALVEVLGLKTVCINFVIGSELEVVAVAGDDRASAALFGRRAPLDAWQELMAHAEQRSGIYFVRDPRPFVDDLVFDAASEEDMIGTPATWGTLNMLVAPMVAADSSLIGMVTADAPLGTPLPDELQLTVLEMFSMQAGMVLDKQRLTEALQREHSRLRESELRFRLAFDGAPIGMSLLMLTAGDAVVVQTNDAFCEMFGGGASGMLERSVRDLVAPDEADMVAKSIGQLFTGELDSVQAEQRYRRLDGSLAWGLMHTAVLPMRERGEAVALCQIVDISAAKEAERALTHQADHDPLTGLANRRVLLNHLDAVVERSKASGQTGAVLFCDLNQFKNVNDLHGHLVGDHVLAEVANRINACVRGEDLVGRLGGDEFVVVAYPLTFLEAQEVVRCVTGALAEPFFVDDIEASVSVSIGMVLITGSLDPTEVLRRADAAMYLGKHGADDGD
jgi:diguanylate cyclase (GGDEF)-like protein/PAS domain S-box-containing protein